MRCTRPLPLVLLLLAAACATSPPPSVGADSVRTSPWTARLVDTLVRLGREDQQAREGMGRAMAENDTAVLVRMMRGDSARSRWLRCTIDERGWPAPSVVGREAAGAAWLILQHSPFHDWHREMLPTIERLAERGELPRGELATYTDRVLVRAGERQRYGTQFDIANGRLVPAPVEDLAGLDARRAAIGMPPMAEYVRVLGEMYGLPVVWPPPS